MDIHLSSSFSDQGLLLVGCLPDKGLTLDSTHPLFSQIQESIPHTEVDAAGAVYLNIGSSKILLVKMGKADTLLEWKKVGGRLFSQVSKHEKVTIGVDALSREAVRGLIYGVRLKAWRFETYHTQARPLPPIHCQHLTFITPHGSSLEKEIREDEGVINSIHWARQICNEPGNIINPGTFVEKLEALRELGIEVQVLDREEMARRGFGALLGVAQGSIHPPFLVSLSWKGSQEDPIALVGKGVTFDSGGLSLKPSSSMEDMKMDKTGAVVVCAVLRSLALRKAKVHAVAVVALVENMLSGSAQRPGDIVTSLSGQTIEVLNTDAEGRLILADALWYAQQQFRPQVVIDVATLTGGARVALGPTFAPIFSNTKELSEQLIQDGEEVGENLWPLPLHSSYDESINSSYADMQNIAREGFGASSATAAQFLFRFIQKGTKWAHLDIASVDHIKSDTDLCPKGASAFGICLLDHWIRRHEGDALKKPGEEWQSRRA